MEINSSLINRAGQELEVLYRDVNSTDELEGRLIQAVHAFCFYRDKLVLVYSANKGYWSPPGGGVEPGESVEQAVIREVREETNMKVLAQSLFGFQDIFETTGTISQTRSVCIVEPYGEFTTDPDGDVTEIKLIDPSEYKNYFDWGVVGDHLMKRALLLEDKLFQ